MRGPRRGLRGSRPCLSDPDRGRGPALPLVLPTSLADMFDCARRRPSLSCWFDPPLHACTRGLRTGWRYGDVDTMRLHVLVLTGRFV